MAKALKPQNSRVRGIVFELDRLELADGRQCELQGRWFGVRGRRFLRPALTLIGDGWRTRLLADLAHKPWDAEEGEPWEAAFEGELADLKLVEAELTVAPDITITLPLSRAGSIARKTRRDVPRAPFPDAGRQPSRRAAASSDLTQPREIARQGRLRVLTVELAEATSEVRQLRSRLARAEAEMARSVTQLDAALGELQQAAGERDGARAERDQAMAELEATRHALDATREELAIASAARDRASADRDALRQATEQAASERDTALTASAQAQSERDAALAARARADLERDAALSVREDAVSERATAIKERDDAVAARDAEAAERAVAVSDLAAQRQETERLHSELVERQAAHGAALVMRRATRARPGANTPTELSRAAPLIGVLVILLGLVLLVALVVV